MAQIGSLFSTKQSVIASAVADLMAGRFFNRLLWQCQQLILQMGIAGSLALVLLAAGVAFYFYVVKPAEINVTQLTRRTEQLRTQAQRQKASSAKQVSPSEQLAAFYKILPQSSSAPAELNKLYVAAKVHNLTLDQGEYRMVREDGNKIVRYEIALPVKGSYPQIRKFVNQALKDIPTIALEGITFQRQKVGESVTQSQIRFTLFLGES